MSTTTILRLEIPHHYYGYVILTTLLGHMVASMVCSAHVMKARKEYQVLYPNLYAVPGYHKHAEVFNRIQRGHQQMLESLTTFSLLTLIGGWHYPILCSVCALIHALGCVLYQRGYADMTVPVETARHSKGGGPLKYIALVGSLFATIRVAGTLNGWW